MQDCENLVKILHISSKNRPFCKIFTRFLQSCKPNFYLARILLHVWKMVLFVQGSCKSLHVISTWVYIGEKSHSDPGIEPLVLHRSAAGGVTHRTHTNFQILSTVVLPDHFPNPNVDPVQPTTSHFSHRNVTATGYWLNVHFVFYNTYRAELYSCNNIKIVELMEIYDDFWLAYKCTTMLRLHAYKIESSVVWIT